MEGNTEMMTILVTVLFIFTLSVFLLCVFLLLKMRKDVETPKIPSLNISHLYEEPMKNQMDRDVLYKRLQESISLKYPEMKMMFEELECRDAMVLHFKGISIKPENVVYVLRNEEARDIFLSTVEEFIEEAKTPKYGMIIALPFKKDNHEILSTIQSNNLSLKYIYTDESCLTSFPHINGMNAMLSIGRKPHASFKVEHDNFNYDWLGELHSQMFEPVYSENAYESIKTIRKLLPLDIRIMTYFYPLFSKTIMNEVIYLYPELANLFYPVLDKREDQLMIFTPNEESLTSSIESLQRSVKDKKVSIQLLTTNTKTYALDTNDEDYSLIKNTIMNTLNVDRVIPVYTENDIQYDIDVPVLSFAPIYQNTLISSLKAKRFYTQLLQLKETR